MSKVRNNKGMDATGRAVLQRFYDGTMRPGETVECLSSYHRMHPTRTIAKGPIEKSLHVHGGALPNITFAQDGRTFDLYDYLATNRVAGLLIMKRGWVVAELYELGLQANTLWASCSMAKSIASTLVGIAVREGAIDLAAPISRYVAPLRGGTYDEVSVRQVLQMVSGVSWNETYTDPTSERRRLLEVQLTLQSDAILAHMSGLSRAAAPGSAWIYNTGESYLVGPLLQAATGEDPTRYLSRKIWSRLGMEQDATWWTVGADGMVLAGSGMSATLRDYARFGQFVLDDGVIDGEALVPTGWFAEAGVPQVIAGQRVPYGYMWWIPELADPMLEGSFQAEGIYGQYLHVNPREELLIVVLSARPKPSFRTRVEFNDDAFFAGVARALR
ncbi:MAG: serine hydrolase [Acidobacteriota bacterium]